MKKSNIKMIALSDLIPNQNWQTRHNLDEANVERLVQAMRDGATLPAILVRPIEGSSKYEIFDGFHRHEAATQLGIEELLAEVFEGDEQAALAEGVTRNLQHGLQLIREDMKRAARLLYVNRKPGAGPPKGHVKGTGPACGSYPWVGRLLGVSDTTVRTWIDPNKSGAKKGREKMLGQRNVGIKVQKEGREAALKQVEAEMLEKWGVEALSRSYEPEVKWSRNYTAGAPGHPILMLSDIHYGEVVDPEQVYNSNIYNRAISKTRVEHTFKTAVSLLKTHFAKPDYEGIVLVLAGDLISGELHDELVATDEVPSLVQTLEIAQIIADGIAFLADEFPQVTVYCVAGNHGRTTLKPRTKFYAQNNLDWLAYQMVKDYTKALDNVSIHAPNSRDLNFVVAGHKYRLTHGDQFRGGDGIIGPIGPLSRGDYKKRVTASLMPGAPEAYDTMLCGHFHQLITLPRFIVNGSVKGYDEFSMSMNFPWQPPQQALWTVHPKHAHTWSMPINCDPNYNAHEAKELTT